MTEPRTSNCCNALIIENSDVCSKCKEHCGFNEELKTLKDLIKENTNYYGQDSLWWEQEKGKEKKFIFPERLKQEAIKWIKEFMLHYQITLEQLPKEIGWKPLIENVESIGKQEIFRYILDKGQQDIKEKSDGFAIIAVLMNFFNITEEDLK